MWLSRGPWGDMCQLQKPRSLQAETSICSFEHELECASTLRRMQRFGGVEASKIAVQAGSSAHSDARCMVHTNIS